MVSFPLFKLGSLLLKTLSKPGASYIKREAGNTKVIKQICVGLGQLAHRVSASLEMRLVSTNITMIKPLSETQALQRGADLLGEAIVFGVAAGIVVVEYRRSGEEKAKAAAAKSRRTEMKQHFFNSRLEAVEAEVAALRSIVIQQQVAIQMSPDLARVQAQVKRALQPTSAAPEQASGAQPTATHGKAAPATDAAARPEEDMSWWAPAVWWDWLHKLGVHDPDTHDRNTAVPGATLLASPDLEYAHPVTRVTLAHAGGEDGYRDAAILVVTGSHAGASAAQQPDSAVGSAMQRALPLNEHERVISARPVRAEDESELRMLLGLRDSMAASQTRAAEAVPIVQQSLMLDVQRVMQQAQAARE